MRDKEKRRIYDKVYYQAHKEERSAYNKSTYLIQGVERRVWSQEYRKHLKQEILGHYSGGTPSCAICGEKRLACLSIDHINGEGRQHRKEINALGGYSFYRWLKRNNYPEGYQVLCMNDQFVKKDQKNENTGVTGYLEVKEV